MESCLSLVTCGIHSLHMMNLDILFKKYGKLLQIKREYCDILFVIYHVSVKFHIKKLGEHLWNIMWEIQDQNLWYSINVFSKICIVLKMLTISIKKSNVLQLNTMCKIQGWKILYLTNTRVYKSKEISKLWKVLRALLIFGVWVFFIKQEL